MNAEYIDKYKIIETVTGSHLYGTSTPTSDEDFVGVFIAPAKYYIGLSTVQEVDLSEQIKLDNGKNSKESVDRKFYEFRKFVKLAMENNPNILELLFTPEPIFANNTGRDMLAHRHLFPHQGCKQKFLGYAFSQKHKMVIKRDNMGAIEDAIETLKCFDVKALVADAENSLNIIKGCKVKGQLVQVGDMSIQRNNTVKEGLRKLEERRSSFSSRHDDFVSKYGYDTKFAMHLVRLMFEGKRLLETGELEFPLPEKAMLLDIRNGKYTIEEIIELSEQMESEIENIKSDLPKKPRYDEIENWMMHTIWDELFR